MLSAALLGNLHAVTDLDTFHRIDTHERTGKVGIQPRKYWLSKAYGHATGHYRHLSADGIAVFADCIDKHGNLIQHGSIRTEKGIVIHNAEVNWLGPQRTDTGQITLYRYTCVGG